MEKKKEEQSNKLILVFSTIVKRMIIPTFKPHVKGGIFITTMDKCLVELELAFGDDLSDDRIVDYCVCQAYAMSKFDASLINNWTVAHSFGKNAVARFKSTSKGLKFYEDKWLAQGELSRPNLKSLIANRKDHPHFKFLYPAHEDITKERMINTDYGYYICGHSTLLWTPFSPACQKCDRTEACKKRTIEQYPELYRIRIEEYATKQK